MYLGRGVNMANLKGKIKKLQTALVKSGIRVKVNQLQFYSQDQNRMITQYHICTQQEKYNQKKEKYEVKDVEILKTCSCVEVIKCLLDLYEQVRV